ncbi:MAG TPA: response regulator [Flavobacterium sp.]|nr:response regulator [Flavobacterium sp.]
MLRCILLDDELLALQYLKLLCEQMEGVEVVKAFNNSEKFIAEKDSLDFDVCITDIEMPVINGLQIANLLSDKHIIFTTAYKDYAVEAFDLDAMDYITKPVQKDRLEKAFRKIDKRTKTGFGLYYRKFRKRKKRCQYQRHLFYYGFRNR